MSNTCKVQSKDPEKTTIFSSDVRHHVAVADTRLELAPHYFGKRRIGVAIMGVGRMGSIHLYNLLRDPRARVLYVLDWSQERLDYFKKKYFLDESCPELKCLHVDQWQQVLDDKRAEAVLISTPTDTHERYARDSLSAGKHVLCEKPLAAKLESVENIVKTAQSKERVLMCAFNRRFDPSFRQVYEQLRRGEIGKVHVIKSCSRDSPTPTMEYTRTSGGIFHDCLVHDIDATLWMVQELPCEVMAYAHAHNPEYQEFNDFDTATITMKFPSGMLAILDVSRYSAAGYEQRCEIFGTKGVLKIDEAPRTHWERHNEIGVTKMCQAYSFPSRYFEAYAREVEDFFNHIEGNQTLDANYMQRLPNLYKTVDAGEHAARSGLPVKLDWTKEELAIGYK